MGLRRMRSWGPAVLLLAGASSAAAQVRRGGEFAVHEHTTGPQNDPAIASAGNGRFIIAWNDHGATDGSTSAIRARRFGADGQPLGPSFQVNTYTTGYQLGSEVASDAAGNVIVVWTSPQDGSGSGVYARRFDTSGNPVGAAEFRVNAVTTDFQFIPRVASSGDGFVVTWTSRHDGGYSIFARRYNAAGLPTTPSDIVVNASPTTFEADASVAGDAAGNFVVTWWGSGAGDGQGIFARRFDSAGTPLGAEFRVNSYVTGYQVDPYVAAAANGEFMIVWTNDSQDGHFGGVIGRRYDASGTPLGPDFIVNVETLQSQTAESVAVDGQGNFIVTWSSFDGSYTDVFARRYDVSGAGGVPFQVNTFTTNTQSASRVAADSDGDFVVTWHSFNQDGSQHSVFAQRFSPDVIFQDDFESASLARWSSSSTRRRGPQPVGLRGPGFLDGGAAGLGGRHGGALRRGRVARERKRLPGPLLVRPERVRPRRGAAPPAHAHLHRVRGNADPPRWRPWC